MRRRLRLPLALASAIGAGAGAGALLRPRRAAIEPARVNAESYFSAAELERARAFRRPQVAIGVAQLVVETSVLVALARRPPPALAARRRRPLVAAGLAGSTIAVGLDVLTLPFGALARQRAVRVGLITQSWGGWARDLVKAEAIGGALAGAASTTLIALVQRRGERWWLPGAAIVTGAAVTMMGLAPVLLDPIFNRFEALAEGDVRDDVLGLAQAAGVRVGEVYEVDASRRTTAANAYVTGLGATKRVVLFDTLLRDFERDELRLVVAHELSHVRGRDVQRSLAFLALVAPAALYAAACALEALPGGAPDATPAALPAAALAVGAAAALTGPSSNWLSRQVERRADAFALELTQAPDTMISFQRRIVLKNLADPAPPAWLTALLATHPPPIERIGAAVAFSRSPRPPEPRTPAGS